MNYDAARIILLKEVEASRKELIGHIEASTREW